MGCDEYYPASTTGSLAVSIQALYTNAVVGSPLTFFANVSGAPSASIWNFGDGTAVTNQLMATHTWGTPGDYPVALRAMNTSNPGGITATLTVHIVSGQIHYVAANSSHPVAPYNSWATAAVNLQDAVNAATICGATVLVSNGVYATGGQVVYGAMNNRVAVTKPLPQL
jgi:PKD repeat protein